MSKQEFHSLRRDFDVERSLYDVERKACGNDHPLAPGSQGKSGIGTLGGEVNFNGGNDQKDTKFAAVDVEEKQRNDGAVKVDAMADPLSGMLLGGGDFDPLGVLGGGSAPSIPTAPATSPPQPHTESKHGVSAAPTSDTTSSSSSGNSREDAGKTHKGVTKRWKDFTDDILLHYNIAGKFRVKANFMTEVDDKEQQVGGKKLPTDKAKARLEKLEATKEQEAMSVEVTQKQYVRRIEKLHRELSDSWKRGERVQSLKIAIQCAKLLQDTSVISFYPSAFVMLTNILDTFGELVYKRLLTRAQELSMQLSSSPIREGEFSASQIPQAAKETCRNWFYKTACIRELVPRLYVEMALMKCYSFLEDGVYRRVVTRSSGIIRGIGDTLVAGWARVYLSKVATQLIPDEKGHFASLIQDYLFTWQQVKADSSSVVKSDDDHTDKVDSDPDSTGLPEAHKKLLKMRGITQAEYTRLHRPAFKWLVNEFGGSADKDDFKNVLKCYRDFCGDGIGLKPILDGFKPHLWAKSSQGVMNLIKEATTSDVTLTDLVGSLGRGLCTVPPPQSQRIPLLNEVWKVVTKDDDLKRYAACSSTWIALTLAHYQEKHVQTLLKDLVKHIRAAPDDDTVEEIVADLESIVDSITAHCGQSKNNFGGIITSSYFMQLLDLFKSDKKTALLKDLLFNFTNSGGKTSDPVIIHTVFDIARSLHDSLDSLSPADERRQISQLLCKFIGQIDFGNDVEQQLKVLVDCRAAFPNLDSVKDRLVLSVAELGVKAHRLTKGRLTRKTSAFVKACLAYCHITIPSIDDVFKRLQLFQLCGQLSLVNGFLPQTDTFFKAAIALVPDIPETIIDGSSSGSGSGGFGAGRKLQTEPLLLPILKSFLSSMVVVPGHPEHGPFYLVKGLLKAAEKYPWKEIKGGKIELYLGLVSTLATYTQEKLPYSVDKVESNDKLFGGNKKYVAKCDEYMSTLIDSILSQLGSFAKLAEGNSSAQKRMCELVLDLINLLISSMDITEHVPLIKRLLNLVKHAEGTSYYTNTILHIRHRAGETESQASRRGGQAGVKQRDALVKVNNLIPPGRGPKP